MKSKIDQINLLDLRCWKFSLRFHVQSVKECRSNEATIATRIDRNPFFNENGEMKKFFLSIFFIFTFQLISPDGFDSFLNIHRDWTRMDRKDQLNCIDGDVDRQDEDPRETSRVSIEEK